MRTIRSVLSRSYLKSRFWASLFLLWAIAAMPLQAQRFRALVHGGLNLSQIDGDRLAGFNQPGLEAGIQANTVLNGRWEWSFGLGFAQQGARRNSGDDPAAALDRIRLNTVEAPLMIHFNEWKFQLGAGLAYNRLIASRVIDISGVDVSAQQELQNDQFSALLEARVFLRENSGFGFRWYKNFSNLQAAQGATRWIGRTININAFFRL